MTDTITAKPATVTPMMQQYLTTKREYQDCLLFYRMGDFYEMFFDDAIKAAEVLDIALTKRGKHDENDIPMCGVPYHSCEPYLQRLIKSGLKVAICEQMESPEEAKKRGYKAVVKREVVRVVTPGTITEDNLLDTRQSNYLAALSTIGGRLALAWVEISTGECKTMLSSPETINADLARLNPKEILVAERFTDNIPLPEWKSVLTTHVTSMFEVQRAVQRLKDFYEVGDLAAFGEFQSCELSACGALIEYLNLTQRGAMPRLAPPTRFIAQHFMMMDAATRRNLELTLSLSGERKGSLLSIIDKTVTGAGARLLSSYISAPLAYAEGINARLDNVQFFCEQAHLREDLRKNLKHIPDIERALSRICLDRASPRDLTAIRDGLTEALRVAELLEFNKTKPMGIRQLCSDIGSHDSLLEQLRKALKDEVGALARDGGFIASGCHAKLDELRGLQVNSRQKLAQLQEEYRKSTGINTLKVTHNNILGFFIEVTPMHSKKMEEDRFIHRQTLASAVRYSTVELQELESNIVSAKDKILAIELEIFAVLVASIKSHAESISLTAQALAALDVASGLAELAQERNYTRPQVDNGTAFTIKGGRHPVVEVHVEKQTGAAFIANDCDLSAQQRLWLLTGPNMAGKSTFLRQNALITILAQIGSYVPAQSAHIGTADRLFSRVGAADDLARGRSTFMVEMVETATILNQSTERSLVILDEIGRGTATYDGLSIAWAVVEHLHNTSRCRTLFATHYHEMTSLTSMLPSLACYTMRVKEWQGNVVFLHEVMHGAADRSYGIHVAKLAGLPKPVIKRATELLHSLENTHAAGSIASLAQDMPLFTQTTSTQPQTPTSQPSAVEAELSALDVDSLTPREALEVLYRLKEEISA